ncbi:pumilio homolog 12-like [Olea europaea subsp. europaea]|uniref:Pumilio homolog 12-like n=1 Tax=Olea europaea subsp. europaea TaxID=158383 RepID=A0A8S0RLI1_OLEEU|nr:pumilio homolog 12-like [Olea europaea subsp. europaea]
MEQKHSQNPNFPASQLSDNQQNNRGEHSFSQETHPQMPLNVNFQTSDQEIQSPFSRLTLSQDFQSQRETSSYNILLRLDGLEATKSDPFSVGFGEKQVNIGEVQQALFRGQAQSNDGGVNGPFNLEVQQNINVRPEIMGFGKRRYLDGVGGDPLRLMKYQGNGFYDTFSNNHEYSFLHGKKPFSGTTPPSPNFLFSDNNFKTFSSRPSLCSNLHLYQQFSIESLRGRIVSLAKDPMWSGILKSKLEEGLTLPSLELVLSEVLEFLSDVITNQFGSQFLQKLFMVCNVEQRTRIIFTLTRNPFKFINICLHSFGATTMQKLLEKLDSSQQISLIVSALSLGVVALANDPSGHLVIQHCVKQFTTEYNKILLNEIGNNCFVIATNKSGCCVMQSCVEHSYGELREWLICNIVANAVHLAEDPYGNYVVQYLLGMKIPEVMTHLVRRFEGNFVSLSFNKYASNVVEKFLETSGEKHSRKIIIELITSPNFCMLLVDPFGNFVIQSALSEAKGHVRDSLLNVIRANVPSIRSSLYGKKILSCLEKMKLSLV